MTEGEAKEFLEERGYGILSPQVWRSDIEKRFLPLWERVKEFTLTSLERGFALFKAVEYICRNRIPGDFVECGVYKGGSCMLLSLALQEFGEGGRKIHLYDTFSGMTEPGEKDIIAWNGMPIAARIQEARSKGNGDYCRWEAGVEEVLKNLSLTGYGQENFVIHPGDVLHTLKEDLPGRISLLRLDTDWYSSTAFELKKLYPRVSARGILFLDDYGHFLGAKEAVEEYFAEQSYYPYLARVDYTARVLVKPA